jgi:hypothetical protein
MSLNIFPDTDVLARAYAELILDYTWKSYTIIYEVFSLNFSISSSFALHEKSLAIALAIALAIHFCTFVLMSHPVFSI